MQRLISVDWRATFGFLKKPDINEGIYLTYNLLHKPALLGILGAVAGLGGYGRPDYMAAARVLEYRRELAGLRVAIAPIEADDPVLQAARQQNPVAPPVGSDRGNFRKAAIKYTNTVGYANDGSTLIVTEQMLLGPAYRTWLLLDDANDVQSRLLHYLTTGQAEYVPYLGKNEFPLWWDKNDVREWEWEDIVPTDYFKIASAYRKPEERAGEKVVRKTEGGGRRGRLGTYLYIERVPIGFRPMGREEQYELAELMLTDFDIAPEQGINNLLRIRNSHDNNESYIIQVI